MRPYEQRARDLDALLAPAELERDNPFIERLMLEHDACIGAEESKRAWVRENFRATLKHAIRELQMEPEPEPVAGWKLVPLEPTPQMLSAVLKEFNRANSLHDAMKMERLPLTDREIYCAMIAAAPPPAQPQELSDEQITSIWFESASGKITPTYFEFARAIERTLKGKP